MAETKGAALIHRTTLIKEHYGEESLDKILAAMNPENRGQLGNLLFSSWYDAKIFKDLNQCTYKVLGGKHPNISEKIGELTAESSLKGIYSSKLKENNVKATLNRVPSIWCAFHKGGEFTIDSIEDNKVLMTIKNYPLPHPEFCANLVGWGKQLITLSGGKSAEVKHTKCVCKKDPYCEIVATWK